MGTGSSHRKASTALNLHRTFFVTWKRVVLNEGYDVSPTQSLLLIRLFIDHRRGCLYLDYIAVQLWDD